MEKHNIEDLITLDLQTFLGLKAKNDTISIESALEIGAYVAANFLRIIYTKNKEIKPEEINGVFGIVSNFYSTYFEGQITEDDFQNMAKKSSELLQNTDFDEMSRTFFKNIISKEKNN